MRLMCMSEVYLNFDITMPIGTGILDFMAVRVEHKRKLQWTAKAHLPVLFCECCMCVFNNNKM